MKSKKELLQYIEELENEMGAISEHISSLENEIEECVKDYTALEDLKLDVQQQLVDRMYEENDL